jgi:hypothetical protein
MKRKIQKIVGILCLILYVLYFSFSTQFEWNSVLAVSSNITVPKNTTTVNINLDNANQSEDPFKDISNNIITAGATIGAVVITHFFAKKRDERRQAQELSEEIEFNKNIKEIVISQLNQYRQFIGYVLTNSTPAPSLVTGLKNLPPEFTTEVILLFQQMPNLYLQLGIERRTRIFHGEILSKIDQVYISFNTFISEIINKNQFSEQQIQRLRHMIEDTLFSLNSL